MTFVSALRHKNGKKNLLHINNAKSFEEAVMAVHATYPGATILVACAPKSEAILTEKVQA